jgi:hypothetical protein
MGFKNEFGGVLQKNTGTDRLQKPTTPMSEMDQMRRSQNGQEFSALPSNSDIPRCGRDFASCRNQSCTAARHLTPDQAHDNRLCSVLLSAFLPPRPATLPAPSATIWACAVVAKPNLAVNTAATRPRTNPTQRTRTRRSMKFMLSSLLGGGGDLAISRRVGQRRVGK